MSETNTTLKKTTTSKTTKKPVAKHIENKRVTIKVANTEIHIGETYEVIGKRDLDAPSGFIEHNTTKLLMAGIKELRSVPYDEVLERFDTGFEIQSACNFKIPSYEKAALVEQYVKLIKEPYETSYNKDVSAINSDFWMGNAAGAKPYICELYTGKTFDTRNPKDLFDLFHALKQGFICEEGEKDSDLQKAKYCIKNKNRVLSLQEERENDKFEANATFSILLDTVDADTDDTLYTILEWMKISNIRGADKETLKRTFIKLISNEKTGYDSAKRFLEAYNLSHTEKGKEKMEIFAMLSKLQLRRKIEFKRSQYFLDDILLGNHLKGAAETALGKPELKESIISAYEQYCTT
jgi:hypothetical protein